MRIVPVAPSYRRSRLYGQARWGKGEIVYMHRRFLGARRAGKERDRRKGGDQENGATGPPPSANCCLHRVTQPCNGLSMIARRC